MSAATSPWPVPAPAPASSRPGEEFTPGRLPQGLIERLFDLCKRANVHAFLADFDKRNLKRIRGDEAVRALSAAGLAVDKADESALMEAYTAPDGFFRYETLLSDVNDQRPSGFFEARPTQDPEMSSPRARFAFTGVCSPSRFGSRAALTAEEDETLAAAFKEMRVESGPHALSVAALCRQFDVTASGLVTEARFTRAILTHFHRLKASDAALLAKAYAGGVGGQVRYCALSDDVTPESGGDPELARSARKAMLRSPCPNQHMSTAMAAGATEEEVRAGFRILLRTLHERRIRISDVIHDFAKHSPFPGRITKSQLVRALSGVGLASVEPRVVDAMAATYVCAGDPEWVDMHAVVADCEATSYLRGLEAGHPDAQNSTFSRDVAASPSPRFTRPEASAEDAAALAAAVKRVKDAAGRNRVTTPRVFADQFDKQKEGYLTVERFMRFLATAKLMPEAEDDVKRILHNYRHASNPSLVDFKGFLLDVELA